MILRFAQPFSCRLTWTTVVPYLSSSAPLVGEFTWLNFSLYLACSVSIRVGLNLSNCNLNVRIDPNVVFFCVNIILFIKNWRKMLFIKFGENLGKFGSIQVNFHIFKLHLGMYMEQNQKKITGILNKIIFGVCIAFLLKAAMNHGCAKFQLPSYFS